MSLKNITLAALLAAGTILASCAQREPESASALEQMAFDAWVEKYVVGQGIAAVRQTNGIWVEFLEEGDQTIDSSADTVVWMMIDYTARDNNNNVFITRDSTEALRQRTFTPHTYYVPEYALIFDEYDSYGMPAGQYFALRNKLKKPDGSTMKISRGSHVKLYMPSEMAYGTGGYTNDQGYGGQYKLGASKIVVQEMAVREVIKNPIAYEEGVVTRLATEQWGLSLTDTAATMIYVDTVNFRPRADLLEQFPDKPFIKEYGITKDSTVNIWYVAKFLPSDEYPEGFILDTNIEAVYTKFYNRRKEQGYLPDNERTEFSAISYKPETDKTSLIDAFYEAIPKLRRGKWTRIAFTSAYAYGGTGQSKALIEFQEYQNQMLEYYQMSSMYGSYGSGYYDNYYGNSYYGYGGYGGGYSNPFYNYSMSGFAEEEDKRKIITEVPPFTPLVFEIYMETEEEDEE